MSGKALPVTIKGKCIFCGKPSLLLLDAEDMQGYYRWKNGELIQRAFPDWSKGKREQLQTGSHEKCFDEAAKEADIEECLAYGHIWPEELTPGVECEICGLEYRNWSKEENSNA